MMPISRQSGISYFSSNAQFSMQDGNFLWQGSGAPWSFGCCLHQVCSLEELSAHQTPARTHCQENKYIYVEYSDIRP